MNVRRSVSIAIALIIAIAGRPAEAQNPQVQVDGAFNVGYTRFTQSIFQPDPNADEADVRDSTSDRVFTEVRPGFAIQYGSPRLVYRLGYQFSGSFDISGNPAYSNQGDLGLVSQPTKFTTLTLAAVVAQGGTSFLLNQRAAEAGQPEIRAPGNPNLISGSLAQSLAWEAGKRLMVNQSLAVSFSAPQEDLSNGNGSMTGSLVFDRPFRRFATGLEVRSALSRLRPLKADAEPYLSVTNTAVIRFSHDFTARWNGLATAGVEQVYTAGESQPLALLPTASASANYTFRNASIGADASHGALTNIQVGTVSLTDRISGRGSYVIDERKLRVLSFSAGILHNEPIGESEASVAAGSGNATQADVGLTTAITKYILGTVRYTYAYQFGQTNGVEAVVTHVFSIGVTGRYSNTDKLARPLPSRGKRVDGSDAKAFPLGGNPLGGDDRVNP
jgi:hypothetical protein